MDVLYDCSIILLKRNPAKESRGETPVHIASANDRNDQLTRQIPNSPFFHFPIELSDVFSIELLNSEIPRIP